MTFLSFETEVGVQSGFPLLTPTIGVGIAGAARFRCGRGPPRMSSPPKKCTCTIGALQRGQLLCCELWIVSAHCRQRARAITVTVPVSLLLNIGAGIAGRC